MSKLFIFTQHTFECSPIKLFKCNITAEKFIGTRTANTHNKIILALKNLNFSSSPNFTANLIRLILLNK